MDKLYWLDQIKVQDRSKVGDKAFYLSKIIQRGYPVVLGFVVSAEILRQFLENLNSSESLVADLPHSSLHLDVTPRYDLVQNLMHADLPHSSLHLDVTNWRQLQQVAGRLPQEILYVAFPALLRLRTKAISENDILYHQGVKILGKTVNIFPWK